MREEVRPGRREGVGGRQRKWRALGGPDSRLWGGQGTRGAHVEHAAHGRDLGRVEAERLVERRRELPSRKAGMREVQGGLLRAALATAAALALATTAEAAVAAADAASKPAIATGAAADAAAQPGALSVAAATLAKPAAAPGGIDVLGLV